MTTLTPSPVSFKYALFRMVKDKNTMKAVDTACYYVAEVSEPL